MAMMMMMNDVDGDEVAFFLRSFRCPSCLISGGALSFSQTPPVPRSFLSARPPRPGLFENPRPFRAQDLFLPENERKRFDDDEP